MSAPGTPVVGVPAYTGHSASRLREIWEFRELLWFFTWRDVAVRYRQTVLGVAWAILQPVLTMVAFSVFFGRLAGMPSDGIPYPIFAFCGLLPWQLFAFALAGSANSLVANERLVTKVYFPRIVIPVAAVLAGLVDFAIAFLVLLLLMAYHGITPTAAAWTVPCLVLLTLASAVAVGLGLAALNVRFRDVRHALPFLAQFWLFLTPIAYPSSLVPEAWRLVYGLNPLVGVVEGFRWAMLGRTPPPVSLLGVGTIVVLLGLWSSTRYFLRFERSFADVL